MSYWYLGSPYSKYPGGIEEAFRAVCREAGRLIAAGIPIYSPIAHTHPIAIYSGQDPFDHAIWLPADAPMMQAARGLIILKMEGWQTSYGLNHEIEVFREAGKPIVFMPPGEIPQLLELFPHKRQPGENPSS